MNPQYHILGNGIIEYQSPAVAIFREHGYEGTSMPELTRRLGICRQSLYKTFGDKRGAHLALSLERLVGRVFQQVGALEGIEPPLGQPGWLSFPAPALPLRTSVPSFAVSPPWPAVAPAKGALP